MSSYIRVLVTRYREAIQAIVEGAPYRNPYNIIKTAIENSLQDLNIDVVSELVDQAAQRFKSLHLELSTPNDGVFELLESLKEKDLRMGVITNSFEGHAKIILKKLKLDHYFLSVIDCGDVQGFKPMSAPFERVVRDLEVDVSNSIYIGDEYHADIVGAKGVGLTTIWINKWERSISDLVAKYGDASTPDFILNSVSEISKML